MAFDMIGEVKFSNDGKKILFVGTLNNKSVIVVDGVESRMYDRIYDIDFSENGASVEFKAKTNDKTFKVVDGKESAKKYYRIGSLHFIDNKTIEFYVYEKGTNSVKRMLIEDSIEREADR